MSRSYSKPCLDWEYLVSGLPQLQKEDHREPHEEVCEPFRGNAYPHLILPSGQTQGTWDQTWFLY